MSRPRNASCRASCACYALPNSTIPFLRVTDCAKRGSNSRCFNLAAPVRSALEIWEQLAREARDARLASDMRINAQADAVYGQSARRCFLRLWEEAASLSRSERARLQLRQELKGKVSFWISEFRTDQASGEKTSLRQKPSSLAVGPQQ